VLSQEVMARDGASDCETVREQLLEGRKEKRKVSYGKRKRLAIRVPQM
jgi:hypothetical protein